MKIEIYNYVDTNYTIIIGRNKSENIKIIDDSVDTDLWFHVNNEPSCHIILKNTKKIKDIPLQVIKLCAYKCKINSKAKNEKKCNVIYTQIKNVVKTEHIGQVAVSCYKFVSI
jgi:predicted ribosome quality control (RQC) complex YloA/Tae2 family protein